jgi:hypothetical protein
MHVGSFIGETEVKPQRIDAASLASFQTLLLIAKAEIEWLPHVGAVTSYRLPRTRPRGAACAPAKDLFVKHENGDNSKSRIVHVAAKKILAKLKNARPSEATLAELIAGEFEESTR